jgi:hypothetical protein
MSSDESQAELHGELAKLLDEQHDVLQRAVYVTMSQHEKDEYDRRACRISEIQQILRAEPA